MISEVIDRNFCRLPTLQVLDVLRHQIRVKGVGMIEIADTLVVERDVINVFVVGIVGQVGNVMFADPRQQSI